MGQFVSDDGGYPLLVGVGGEGLVIQQRRLSVRDQTPVLHGSRVKIRDGDLICRTEEILKSQASFQWTQPANPHISAMNFFDKSGKPWTGHPICLHFKDGNITADAYH